MGKGLQSLRRIEHYKRIYAANPASAGTEAEDALKAVWRELYGSDE